MFFLSLYYINFSSRIEGFSSYVASVEPSKRSIVYIIMHHFVVIIPAFS